MSAINQNIDDIKVPCSFCNKTYAKSSIKNHEDQCVATRTCPWCKIVFKNQGNLASHSKHLHQNRTSSNTTTKEDKEQIICHVCEKIFMTEMNLRFHIRQEHFNLKPKIKLRDTKKINQVWLERVYNSSDVVEMCKKDDNKFIIKKCRKHLRGLKIDEEYSLIDLSLHYPTQFKRVNCEICNKSVIQKSYKKHLDNRHKYKETKKHHCYNCNKSFNRLYFYVKHVCNKTDGRKRKRFTISKVENLEPIPI